MIAPVEARIEIDRVGWESLFKEMIAPVEARIEIFEVKNTPKIG